MKAEIDKILHEEYGGTERFRSEREQSTKKITALIIKWLEGKKVKITHIDYFSDNDQKHAIRNQTLTELIGEMR